jgi:formylglycine-generating enzyme required for sulfatase activity
MNQLGYIYENGLGVHPDYRRAEEWYLKAANSGNAEAMRSMGWLFEKRTDYLKAAEWYQKAADGGCGPAKQALAEAQKYIAEIRKRDEQRRLAEQREKERLAAKQREEQLATQREKDRLAAAQAKQNVQDYEWERRQREEQERLAAPPVPIRIIESAQPALQEASKDHPWENSLGMKFVPVAGTQVLFSIWDTRVQDFQTFVTKTNYNAPGDMVSKVKRRWGQPQRATWREPGFSQEPTCPVVGVNWYDAKKFCEWLTLREQDTGTLPRGRVYRLPTDAEWSAAVGLLGEKGNHPIDKSGRATLYSWGKEGPPPQGAGNYSGEESGLTGSQVFPGMIKGYRDGYPQTSPVGSFAANANGLYDMGGNVWQWCEDRYNPVTKALRFVLGGHSWSDAGSLNLSYRKDEFPDFRSDDIGFRCVVATKS